MKTVAVKLAETRSFPTEPYAEYAHNLSQIATGLNQGKASNYTEQQAPSTLVNYAHPLLKTDLEAMLDPKMEDTTFKLDGAAVLLTRLAKSDGRMSTIKRHHNDDEMQSRAGRSLDVVLL